MNCPPADTVNILGSPPLLRRMVNSLPVCDAMAVMVIVSSVVAEAVNVFAPFIACVVVEIIPGLVPSATPNVIVAPEIDAPLVIDEEENAPTVVTPPPAAVHDGALPVVAVSTCPVVPLARRVNTPDEFL